MSVLVDNDIARLLAPSRVEDAEVLWRFLQTRRHAEQAAAVDLSASGPLHAATVQVLLVYRPRIAAVLTDPFQRTWLSPLLDPPAATSTVGGGA